jgi:prophage regulatory protein
MTGDRLDELGIDYYVRIKDVVQITGLSRTSVYRMLKAGNFPKPYNLSERCVAWRISALKEWISEREQQR